jgi:aldehyde dehydrogenase (NAD+)
MLSLPARAALLPQPRGISLIVAPWNYPVQLSLMPLIGSIAAGCCSVVKTSEFAPASSAAVAELIRAAFDERYVTVVEGDRDISEALLQYRFDTIFFTGGSVAGRAVMAAAARHLTPVILELGGKSPCVVCADAPLDVAARRIVWGKFMNAGQTCVAPDFVLVEKEASGPLIARMKQAITDFYGKQPAESADYGRIINRRHFDRLASYLADAQIAHGGQTDPSNLYIAPTILTGVSWQSPIMQEEIFGPILPVFEVRDLNDAIGMLQDQLTPLAAYLFTLDNARIDDFLARSRSGGVCINDTVAHMIGASVPFGGLGNSGIGSYHGKASFDCFTHHRPVVKRSLRIDPAVRYPPQSISISALKRMYRFLLRR